MNALSIDYSYRSSQTQIPYSRSKIRKFEQQTIKSALKALKKQVEDLEEFEEKFLGFITDILNFKDTNIERPFKILATEILPELLFRLNGIIDSPNIENDIREVWAKEESFFEEALNDALEQKKDSNKIPENKKVIVQKAKELFVENAIEGLKLIKEENSDFFALDSHILSPETQETLSSEIPESFKRFALELETLAVQENKKR